MLLILLLPSSNLSFKHIIEQGGNLLTDHKFLTSHTALIILQIYSLPHNLFLERHIKNDIHIPL